MSVSGFPDWFDDDRSFIWHPYSSFASPLPLYPVDSAEGVHIRLADGRELIDAMASWWCVIHGYSHPEINEALKAQIDKTSHVMFGGLTHEPAAQLAKKLVELTPETLTTVFFSDSGSVSVEVALKMAIQYWHAKGQTNKQRFISLRQAYHGDTIGAMSVCDPVTGMHTLFSEALPEQIFVSSPSPLFGEICSDEDISEMRKALKQYHHEVAAVIMEPIVQGAGGMRFYSADYLKQVRALCNEYNVLLILDEIATGFGRTGKLFASEHADISADIMCVGKALTGGYMSLAATLTASEIAETISNNEPGVFMHGPTFMANPLACAAANASISLLENSNWQNNIKNIESLLKENLSPCIGYETVSDVRVLGAIGVVEMVKPVDMNKIVPRFVDGGVWIRPFGKLVYTMPAYCMDEADLKQVTSTMCDILKDEAILLGSN